MSQYERRVLPAAHIVNKVPGQLRCAASSDLAIFSLNNKQLDKISSAAAAVRYCDRNARLVSREFLRQLRYFFDDHGIDAIRYRLNLVSR